MFFTKYSDILIAGVILGVLLIMLIPLSPDVLDVLLTINISFSLIMLFVIIYTKEAVDFSVFPSLLLVITLYRLSLNIASTRLILLEADAGKVIETFGNFVVGGDIVVGIVIFFIFIIIQFVVITKGAGRVAEVGARFTLDAMPGKQMSIDADLNAGLIDEKEARRRREKITKEADFYGSMDGASKFVRGDAVAGIIITLINIVGGLVIGVLKRDMPIADAGTTYTLLTVGDGLVSQLPALIISTASGLLVTKAASENNLGSDIATQMLVEPKVMFIASGFLLLLSFMGLPRLPLLICSALVAGIGLLLRKGEQEEVEIEEPAEPEPSHETTEMAEIDELLTIDPLEIEIGYGLITLVENESTSDLLGRISVVRKQIAAELGMILPTVRIRDNIELNPNQYIIKINGIKVGAGDVYPNKYLAMNPGNVEVEFKGIETIEPAFGAPAIWIEESQREMAEISGYTVVEAVAVIITHLTEIIKQYSAELITRQDVQKLIDKIKEKHQVVVDELIPSLLNLGAVHKILQNLLRERVSIKNLPAILEALADYAGKIKDLDMLTEFTRRGLAREICAQYVDENSSIAVATVSPDLEQRIVQSIKKTPMGSEISLDPAIVQKINEDMGRLINEIIMEHEYVIVLCSPNIRMYFRKIIESNFPFVVVLSYNEIVKGVALTSLGVVKI